LSADIRRHVVSSLVAAVLLAGCEPSTADSVVARHMGEFYSAYLGRDLTRAELQEMTQSFVKEHAKGRDRQAIRDFAKLFDESTRTLRAHDDDAVELTLRHQILEANYFVLEEASPERRLFLEPDPVRIADARSRRLMTERDVIALANIRNFAKSSGPPRHKELSRRQIEDLVALLKENVGGNRGRMPQFFGEAAAFWAGVREQWPRLSAQEKELARAYALKTWRIQLQPEMYAKLWGLTPRAASSRYADDVGNRISAITQLNIALGNLPARMDAIFGP
jgi:hypothetical protein